MSPVYKAGAFSCLATGPRSVAVGGLEPPASRLWAERSGRLSYTAMVGRAGVEPAPVCLSGSRSNLLSCRPMSCAEGVGLEPTQALARLLCFRDRYPKAETGLALPGTARRMCDLNARGCHPNTLSGRAP
jgi:hypothetical protein